MLNQPGKWTLFCSHSRASPTAPALVEKLTSSLKERFGWTSWLDVNMEIRTEEAMQEGVENSSIFVAVVSDDGPPDRAYFDREFCRKEAEWALEAGVPIQVVIHSKDKERIGELLEKCPKKLRAFFANVEWVHLDRTDPQYWAIGVDKVATAIAGVLGIEARPALASGAEDNSFIALLRENSLAQFAASLIKTADFASADEVFQCSEAELEELGLEVGMKKMALKRFVHLSQVTPSPTFENISYCKPYLLQRTLDTP